MPVFEVTLLLDIPIQTRVMQGRRDAAAATRSRLQYQQAFARDRIEADVLDAHSGIHGARDRIQATRREVKLAVELEQAERVRFEQGDSHLLIVNVREQQTAEAELREVDASLDYHRAVADLRAARGE
jgi:outer membrane protein, heavy metal efflux system